MKTVYIIPVIILMASCGYFKEKKDDGLIRDCPDEKIVDKMPRIIQEGRKNEPNAYFIYKGERKELTDFDLDWVNKNCAVRETEVH